MPVEHVCNLAATHPAAAGVEWSKHLWIPVLAGLPYQPAGFTFGEQPVLLKGMCTPLACVQAEFLLEIHDRIFCLRNSVHYWEAPRLFVMLCHRFVRSLSWVLAQTAASLLTWTAAAACSIDTDCADLGHEVHSKVWSVSSTCQTLQSLLLSHLLSEVLSCPTLPLYTAATLQPHTLHCLYVLKLWH